MISNRQWMAICLAGVCWNFLAFAQDATGTGGGAAGGADATGTTGTGKSTGSDKGAGTGKSGTKSDAAADTGAAGTTKPAAGKGGTNSDSPSALPGGKKGSSTTTSEKLSSEVPSPEDTPDTGASSAFGTSSGTKLKKSDTAPAPNNTAAPDNGPAGASSAFGSEGGSGNQLKQAPPSYTVPGFFGSPSTTFTGGQGRLARPHFRYTASISQGFDDNVLQTPTHQVKAADQQVLVRQGTADVVTFVPVTTTTYEQAFAGPIIYFRPVTRTTFQQVTIPGTKPVIRTIKAPEPQDRVGSPVSRASIAIDAQRFSKRSLFTMDLNAQIDEVWNRPAPSSKQDYSGSLALNYIYNFTPRLAVTASGNIAYIAQPDVSRINTPDRLGAGDIVNAQGRLSLAYRLTPRLSTTLSVGQNAIFYLKKNGATQATTGTTASTLGVNPQNGNNYETTYSAEIRYLWKPRYTLLGEFRHVLISYPDTPTLDSSSNLLLIGADMKLSSRISATIRLGESIRTYDQSGKSNSSPYGEASLDYRLSPTSAVQWNSRYGYEESSSADIQTLSYRTSLSYLKNFTPRFHVAGTASAYHRTGSASSGGNNMTEDTFDISVSLQYHVTQQFNLSASFSFTTLLSSTREQDYDRSRVFFGGEYTF